MPNFFGLFSWYKRYWFKSTDKPAKRKRYLVFKVLSLDLLFLFYFLLPNYHKKDIYNNLKSKFWKCNTNFIIFNGPQAFLIFMSLQAVMYRWLVCYVANMHCYVLITQHTYAKRKEKVCMVFFSNFKFNLLKN